MSLSSKSNFIFLLQENSRDKSEGRLWLFSSRRPHEGVEWQRCGKSVPVDCRVSHPVHYGHLFDHMNHVQPAFTDVFALWHFFQTKTLTGGGMEGLIEIPVDVSRVYLWHILSEVRHMRVFVCVEKQMIRRPWKAWTVKVIAYFCECFQYFLMFVSCCNLNVG